jgi:hypothetical protein
MDLGHGIHTEAAGGRGGVGGEVRGVEVLRGVQNRSPEFVSCGGEIQTRMFASPWCSNREEKVSERCA